MFYYSKKKMKFEPPCNSGDDEDPTRFIRSFAVYYTPFYLHYFLYFFDNFFSKNIFKNRKKMEFLIDHKVPKEHQEGKAD